MRKLVQMGSHSARPSQVFGDKAESAWWLGIVCVTGDLRRQSPDGSPALSVTVCQRPLRDPPPATRSILSPFSSSALCPENYTLPVSLRSSSRCVMAEEPEKVLGPMKPQRNPAGPAWPGGGLENTETGQNESPPSSFLSF